MPDPSFSDSDMKRYNDWKSYLRSNGISIPQKEHFTNYASLPTLCRLRPVLAVLEPETIGPMRVAISELAAEKNAKRASRAKGGKKGVARQVSVEKEELPSDWQATIARLYSECENESGDWIDFDSESELSTLPWSTVRDAEYVLCMIAKACINRNKKVSLKSETVAYWIQDARDRGCGARGLSCQIGKLRSFVLHYQGQKSKLAKKLSRLRKHYNRLAAKEPKRKVRFLLTNPNDIGKVLLRAEELLDEARGAPLGFFHRIKLFLDAAALALSIVAPLRISDLHRLEVGVHLIRHNDGWEMNIETQKTGGEYHRSLLYPEITPFLDALIMEDAPGRHIEAGYTARIGTPIFSRDNGRTGLSGDWISDVWFEYFGCGAHISRTLWHEEVHDENSSKTYIALELCGQKDPKTANQYLVRDMRKRNFQKGKQLRSNYRKRVQATSVSW
nr:hypothetical protein [uncultured Cohaesibacter sp.]